MEKIKVSSVRVEQRDFVNAETGEVSANFALIFGDAVPVMRKQTDGTFAESTDTIIIKPAKQVSAILYAGCDELRKVRVLKGSSLTATQISAYLEGATAEVTAKKIAANTVDGDYTWTHDGFKYDVTITLAADIIAEIKAASAAIRRKALGL